MADGFSICLKVDFFNDSAFNLVLFEVCTITVESWKINSFPKLIIEVCV